ncbi:MAG: flavodoxin family protein [Deltaproteobacteria bacterium]|jgi:multimeric flavodoxin WrbA|nr:flavodoxin family protein [Deltaproteobacteria bacterium]MDH3774363.1 flavodoxin family protein [Deltaproteobacteria bacterium]MDH3800683.1 flavodoxin family protein [Deltaproteobacteria bacterium]MDH3849966.1 flavodoxin family protein [Deltaproteobacteria bacterium]MDH3897085.1 flavodoxin family protein [Deltaproteobacteria bacterium]
MKVLGILGSPRREGNTEILLDEALRGAGDHGGLCEKVILRDLKITPCLEIYKCAEDGVCAIQDEMQGLFPKIIQAERLLLASPIFFYSVPALAKAMIDRCQSLWAKKYILKLPVSPIADRKGVFISVAATRGKKLFDGVRLTVKYFFDAIDVAYSDELFVRGADEKGEVRDQPEALKAAYELGRRLVLEQKD